jgi:MFS family permease
MQLMTMFFIVGPVFEALSPNIGVMAFGRLLSGMGAGAAVVVVPIYISEIAPPAERGFFGAFTQIGCNVGILVTQLLGYFLSHDQYWRIILAAGGVIGVAQSLGLFLSVESPRYLADRGHPVQAKRILRKLRGEHVDIDEEVSSWSADGADGVADEEQTLLRDGEDEQPTPGKANEDALTIVQIFRHPYYQRAALAVIMVMLAQQLSGMLYHTVYMIESGLTVCRHQQHRHVWRVITCRPS